MTNRRNVIIAASLVVVSLAGFTWFLTGQGLDDAEKWVSILGMFVSVCLGAGGVALGWLTLRHSRTTATRPWASASGRGATAIAGDNDGGIDTEVSGSGGQPAGSPPATGGVSASGAGATAIGGHNRGDIRTRVTGTDQGGRP